MRLYSRIDELDQAIRAGTQPANIGYRAERAMHIADIQRRVHWAARDSLRWSARRWETDDTVLAQYIELSYGPSLHAACRNIMP